MISFFYYGTEMLISTMPSSNSYSLLHGYEVFIHHSFSDAMISLHMLAKGSSIFADPGANFAFCRLVYLMNGGIMAFSVS